MKLHVKKEKIEEKGFLGLGIGKTKWWWSVKVKLELNDMERSILKDNKELLEMTLIEHYWKSKKLEQSHPIKWLIDAKGDGMPYCADDNAELLEIENAINGSAANFKNHLLALSQAEGGSSVTEL